MKTVLIVSPHFPPVDAADMHRVRMTIPHLGKFDWRAVVLTIDDRQVSMVKDPRLMASIPAGTIIERVRAIPERVSRIFGVGNATIRAYASLFEAGLRLIRRERVDVVYFSTTQFIAFTLGPIWRRLTDVPFILDLQDPWTTRRTIEDEASSVGLKRRAMRRIHRVLESATVPSASGFVSVSRAYVDELKIRYPRVKKSPSAVLPFGVTPRDFDLVGGSNEPNGFFDIGDGKIHGVYLGRGGSDMERALRIVIGAVKSGLQSAPRVFSRLRLHFVGTDYAPHGQGKESVLPIAQELGAQELISEQPERIPYLDGLTLLNQSDFLLVVGSDDPRYTASKLFPYLLTGKPLFAAIHERSPMVPLLEQCGCTGLTTFGFRQSDEDCRSALAGKLETYLANPSGVNPVDCAPLDRFSCEAMARNQCELFDVVRAGALVPLPKSELAE